MAALLSIILSLVILTAFEPAVAFDDAMATSNIAGLGSLSHVVAEARAAENADWIVALRREIHMVLTNMGVVAAMSTRSQSFNYSDAHRNPLIKQISHFA